MDVTTNQIEDRHIHYCLISHKSVLQCLF